MEYNFLQKPIRTNPSTSSGVTSPVGITDCTRNLWRLFSVESL